MQLLKASRDAVLKPLQVVTGIIERRHTLPILSNVMITKSGEEVAFTGTDIEIQIRTAASLSQGQESLGTTVSARKLLDILKTLPESAEVQISQTAKKMSIAAGRSRFTLQTLEPGDFPTMAEAAQYTAGLDISQKTLKRLLSMVHFAMAQQDIRYYLNGVLLVVDGPQIAVVATDGHRLAYCSAEDANRNLSRQEVIIPRKTVLELSRLLGDTDDTVEIALAGNQAKFSFQNIELWTKLVEGKFPDYQRVIPKGYQHGITLSREVLTQSLQRTATLTSDKFRGVRFGLDAHALTVQVNNTEQEEASDEIECEFSGTPMTIGFNISYLLDVLANLKTDQVRLEFGDAHSSALLTVPGDEGFKYVVMPMRI
jgi:DNA polymerase III subunit beta